MGTTSPFLGQEAFRRWLEASHGIFEVFEGRYDAYPLSQKWLADWLTSGKFEVTEDALDRLRRLRESLDYSVFGVSDPRLRARIDDQFRVLVEEELPLAGANIGMGIAPFLFTWNFQRFREYLDRKPNMDLGSYFRALGDVLEAHRRELDGVHHLVLLTDGVKSDVVQRIFESISRELSTLGVGQREPVGTIKLLHIAAPYYFPLLDNRIAEVAGIKDRGQAVTLLLYIDWMRRVGNWLQDYKDVSVALENEFALSILKLLDEALYIMSSINLSARVRLLGI
jgi:hypothetical protein